MRSAPTQILSKCGLRLCLEGCGNCGWQGASLRPIVEGDLKTLEGCGNCGWQGASLRPIVEGEKKTWRAVAIAVGRGLPCDR
jgi:hypothetical protein